MPGDGRELADQMGRRAQPRIRIEVDALVIMRFSPEGKVDPDGVAISKTADVSVDGMKINIDAALIEGTVLQVYLFEKDTDKKYMVMGEVVWCRQVDGAYQAGFCLLDADLTDIDGWRSYLSNKETIDG